jgi:hypothetical protein
MHSWGLTSYWFPSRSNSPNFSWTRTNPTFAAKAREDGFWNSKLGHKWGFSLYNLQRSYMDPFLYCVPLYCGLNRVLSSDLRIYPWLFSRKTYYKFQPNFQLKPVYIGHSKNRWENTLLGCFLAFCLRNHNLVTAAIQC